MGMILFNFKNYLDIDASAKMAMTAVRMNWTHEVVIAPSLASAGKVLDLLKGSSRRFRLCAQDIDIPGSAGPYTGKTTVHDLKRLGCTYALIGHSEVRHRAWPEEGDSDELVAMKIRLALDSGLVPVLCFGETRGEKAAARTKEIARRQVKSSLRYAKRSELERIIFAYEPVWAIKGHGAAQACSASYAADVVDYVKKAAGLNSNARFLYGGSVSGMNIKEYMDGGFHGVLVGRAGTDMNGLKSLFAGVK